VGGTQATFESRCCHSFQDGAGEVLNARVNCHPVVYFQIERNLIFQVSLEVGPDSAPEIRAIRWVLDERHVVSMSTRRWSVLSAEHEVRYTEQVRFLFITMSKTLGVAKGLCGLVVGVSGLKIRQELPSAGVLPLLCSAASFNPRVWR